MGGGGASFGTKGKLSVEGLKYHSNFEEFKHINARDKDLCQRIIDWEHRTHGSLEDLYYEAAQRHLEEMAENAREIDIDKAHEIVGENIPEHDMHMWFREADSLYKPRLFSYVMDNPQLLNAGWNIAYDHYKWLMKREGKNPLSFKKWLKTPQTYYRGDSGNKSLIEEDRFVAYSPDKDVANKFAGSYDRSRVSFVKIRPIDTLGGYVSIGEMEYWVPRWKVK